MISLILEIIVILFDLALLGLLLSIFFSIEGAKGLIELFATRIPILNSIFGAMFTFVALMFGNSETTPYDNPFNLFETILIVIGVFILFYLAQKTKIGFGFLRLSCHRSGLLLVRL